MAAALLSCNGGVDSVKRDGSMDAARDAGATDVNQDVSTVDAPVSDTAGSDTSSVAACSLPCHGSQTTAPPLGLKGQTSTTDRAVGAHQSHLKSSNWHVQVKCTDCHLVPAQTTDKGHIDTALPAEVTFSAAAKAKGANPAWTGTTCSGTYCHGATLSGGSVTAPTWTKVDGIQVKCTSCHGMPPTNKHTTSDTKCSTCHAAVVDSGNKIKAPSLHIDGKVTATSGHPAGYGGGPVHGPDFNKDPSSCKACHGSTLTGGSAKGCESCHPGWKTKCTFCHGGTLNNTGAPPEAVDGKTAVTVPGVGRHTSHVTEGSSHGACGCALCHKMPTSALSAGHIDPAPAEVTFTGVATGSSYSFSTYYCTNVYCHGNGKISSSGGSALWIGSLSGGCSACHDDESDGSGMNLSGEHKKHIIDKKHKCNTCHSCVVSATKTIVNKTKHIDGKMDVCSNQPLNWDASTKTCNPSCHGSETW